MLPDRVSNPGPLTYESGALPIALCGPAHRTSLPICSHSGEKKTNSYSRITTFQQYFSHIRSMRGQNERLYAIQPSLQLERFPPPERIKLKNISFYEAV